MLFRRIPFNRFVATLLLRWDGQGVQRGGVGWANHRHRWALYTGVYDVLHRVLHVRDRELLLRHRIGEGKKMKWGLVKALILITGTMMIGAILALIIRYYII